MKKSGRTNQTKKHKQRKLIEIKESIQISPVKEVFQPEESKLVYKKQKSSKLAVPPIPKNQYQFNNNQLELLSSHADGLVSLELMRKIIHKQKQCLNQFHKSCPELLNRALQHAVKNVENCLNLIRDERVQRMKQQTVIFIPPDKDNFQRQKGKILNNWIKQQIKVWEQKDSFQKPKQQYIQLFKDTENKISKLAVNLPKQKLQSDVQNIVTKINQKNKHQIQTKTEELLNVFLQVINTTDQMRSNKQRLLEQKHKRLFCQPFQKQKYLSQKFSTHSIELFSVQDYFM